MPYGIRNNTIIGKNINQEADLCTIDYDKDHKYKTILDTHSNHIKMDDYVYEDTTWSPYFLQTNPFGQPVDWNEDRVSYADFVEFDVDNLINGTTRHFVFACNDTHGWRGYNKLLFGCTSDTVPSGCNSIYELIRFLGFEGDFIIDEEWHSAEIALATYDDIRPEKWGPIIELALYPNGIAPGWDLPMNAWRMYNLIVHTNSSVTSNCLPIDEVTIMGDDEGKLSAQQVPDYTEEITKDIYLGAPASDVGNTSEWMKASDKLSDGEPSNENRNKPVRNDVVYNALFNGTEELKTQSQDILDAINELYDKLTVIEINKHDLDD